MCLAYIHLYILTWTCDKLSSFFPLSDLDLTLSPVSPSAKCYYRPSLDLTQPCSFMNLTLKLSDLYPLDYLLCSYFFHLLLTLEIIPYYQLLFIHSNLLMQSPDHAFPLSKLVSPCTHSTFTHTYLTFILCSALGLFRIPYPTLMVCVTSISPISLLNLPSDLCISLNFTGAFSSYRIL